MWRSAARLSQRLTVGTADVLRRKHPRISRHSGRHGPHEVPVGAIRPRPHRSGTRPLLCNIKRPLLARWRNRLRTERLQQGMKWFVTNRRVRRGT